MGFVLAVSPTYKQVIKFDFTNEAGKVEKASYTAVFKRLSSEQIDDLQVENQRFIDSVVKSRTDRAADRDADQPFDLRVHEQRKKHVREVLEGFEDLIDDDKQPVEFSDVSLEALLAVPEALNATYDQFWKKINAAREKN